MALRGLDLTDAQKEQVKAIHERTRQEVEAVLTPEQLEKLKARRGGRGGRGGGR
jgi:Spy/CpxP family protein refolding chaperone